MLYFNWWNAICKQWAEVALGEGNNPAAPPAPTCDDALPDKEKYDYLTEYGTQILCMFEAEKGCTYLSRNFETVTEHPGNAFLGKDFYSLIHGDFRERLKRLLANDSAKSTPQPFRCKLQHADKQWYWYLLRIHPKQDKPGKYVCIAENIHDNMLAQNTLQKARLEAELALRARSEFLSNMSHELRTPLNAVIGFSQIIESGMFGAIENPQYMEYIKNIQQSGHDLLSRIEDLLEIANIDAGRVQLAREEIYAGDLLRHVREAQEHHAGPGRIVLEAVSQEGDMLLHVDRLKMQHILGHLVSNAIRFSREGGKVTLSAERSGRGQLLLRVHDTGAGIADAKLSTLAAALREENCWTAENNRSIGLGLALTREFVALHGGNVHITSKPGAGTTVDITLPKDCVRTVTVRQVEKKKQAVN